MKKLMYLFIVATTMIVSSCSDDDSTDQPPGIFDGDSKTYQLQSRADASVSGTATVVENEDGTATVNLKLTGTSAGSFPAHIHANSAVETGDILIDLNASYFGVMTPPFSVKLRHFERSYNYKKNLGLYTL